MIPRIFGLFLSTAVEASSQGLNCRGVNNETPLCENQNSSTTVAQQLYICAIFNRISSSVPVSSM